MAEAEYVLELKGITKIFPGVKALNRVDFQLRRGEIHALMGENGAGKSTFIKVITGVHKAEEGVMFLDGKQVSFRNPKDAQQAGIAAIYQHVTAYPHLTVTENIFMGHEKFRRGVIQWKEMHRDAQALLDELNADFRSTTLMGALSVAQQQMVEIAKALSMHARIIIMDEPTKGVDVGAKAAIYEIMGDLAQQGYAIVMISSEMPEILGMCDRVFVMCDGRVTGELDRKEASQELILELAMSKSRAGQTA